jgi:hypothetical protein
LKELSIELYAVYNDVDTDSNTPERISNNGGKEIKMPKK